MDKDDAIAEAKRLLGAQVTSQLSDEDWEVAAAGAVTVDDQGRLPGANDWTPSYEPFWLAGLAVETLAIRADLAGGLEQFASEGASFTFRTADLRAAARALFATSPLSPLRGSGIGYIDIDSHGSRYVPRSGSPWLTGSLGGAITNAD